MNDNKYYAYGYNGNGVSLSTFFGKLLAELIDEKITLDELPKCVTSFPKSMNFPILKFFCYQINKAIVIAAAIGFIIALFGTMGFLFSGNYLNANLPLSIGFLNIPAFLIFLSLIHI